MPQKPRVYVSRYAPAGERTRYQLAQDRACTSEILTALREVGGDHETAARELGIALRHLHREIDRLKIREKTRAIRAGSASVAE